MSTREKGTKSIFSAKPKVKTGPQILAVLFIIVITKKLYFFGQALKFAH